jgi:hypothetical protein
MTNGPRRWRVQAAAVIEELFSRTEPAHWDALLDLRSAILRGNNWEAALDLFLRCKARMENDNYLPFYRLRRLLAASLRFETSGLEGVGEDALSLASILRQPHLTLWEAREAMLRASGPFRSLRAARRSKVRER